MTDNMSSEIYKIASEFGMGEEDKLAKRLVDLVAFARANAFEEATYLNSFAGFESEIEAARRHNNTKHLGGQKVSPTGDFVYVMPSAIGRMEWWLNAFRDELESLSDKELEKIT